MTVYILAAWAWLKKNWKWVVFPLGILVWLAKNFFMRPTVVSPELVQHMEERARIDEEARVRAAQAELARNAQVTKVEEKHDAQVAGLNAEAVRTSKELQGDPVKLNDFLKKVGADARRPRS